MAGQTDPFDVERTYLVQHELVSISIDKKGREEGEEE